MTAENVGLLLVILWSGRSSSILRHGAGEARPQERDVRGDGLGERGDILYIFSSRVHMSGLANGGNLTENGWNVVEDKKKV